MRPARLALAIVLAGAPAAAQTADAVPPEVRRAAALSRLEPGRVLLVRAQGVGRLAGPFVRRDTGHVVVGPYLGYGVTETAIPIPGLDSLWVRGHQLRKYAIIGAAAGTLLGIVFTQTKSGLCGDSTGTRTCSGNVAVGALLGAAGGGLAGAVVGASVPRWELRFPLRGPKPKRPRAPNRSPWS